MAPCTLTHNIIYIYIKYLFVWVRLCAKTRCLCMWVCGSLYILLYMGGRFANVRVYWTGYGREKGPWRFLTCGEDLWTVRPFVCPYTAVIPPYYCVCTLTHKRARSYFMLYTHAHTDTHTHHTHTHPQTHM